MTQIYVVSALVIAMATSAFARAKQPRIAVVVANNHSDDTEKYPDLRFAESEAHEMAAVLKKYGDFDVRKVIGQGSAAVGKALQQVIEDVETSPGGLVVFYYSGHQSMVDTDRQSQLLMGDSRFELIELHAHLKAALVIVWSITITRPPSRPPDRVAANGLWRAEPVEASGQRGG